MESENTLDLHAHAHFGVALRSRRKALGLTQEDLADLADVSLRFVHELEHGKQTVQLDKLLAVLNALGWHLAIAPGSAPGITTP